MPILFRLAAVVLGLSALVAHAGGDDDAPYRGDGATRNAVDPIYFDSQLADFPTHADPGSGLRMFPPTATELFAGQRFDLRIETQLPAKAAPTLVKLAVNGKDVTRDFLRRIERQGVGLESGTPPSPLLFGASARNLSFDRPGIYEVDATVAAELVIVHIIVSTVELMPSTETSLVVPASLISAPVAAVKEPALSRK